MNYELKPGDRVRLTRTGVIFYGGAWPHFVPQGQGGGAPGTVLAASDRPHKPGAAPRPYYVRWDNGIENSYRVEDLECAIESAAEFEPAEESESAAKPEPYAKIVPFVRP